MPSKKPINDLRTRDSGEKVGNALDVVVQKVGDQAVKQRREYAVKNVKPAKIKSRLFLKVVQKMHFHSLRQKLSGLRNRFRRFFQQIMSRPQNVVLKKFIPVNARQIAVELFLVNVVHAFAQFHEVFVPENPKTRCEILQSFQALSDAILDFLEAVE